MQNLSDEEINSRKVTRFEILLIALILFFSIAAILWIRSGDPKGYKEGSMAVIYQGDKVLEKVGLEKDKIFFLPDGKMQIEVNKSRVRVAWSDCPKQICVKTGWIKNPWEVIVCVPNKVLIEIEAADIPALDAVVR